MHLGRMIGRIMAHDRAMIGGIDAGSGRDAGRARRAATLATWGRRWPGCSMPDQ
jgi:hypothetical protein